MNRHEQSANFEFTDSETTSLLLQSSGVFDRSKKYVIETGVGTYVTNDEKGTLTSSCSKSEASTQWEPPKTPQDVLNRVSQSSQMIAFLKKVTPIIERELEEANLMP